MKIIKFFFFLFLFSFPLGQLGRISLEKGVVVYLNDILLVFLIIAWLLFHLASRQKISWPPLTVPILAFVIIGGISLLNASRFFAEEEILIGFLYLLRWITYAGLYFVVYELVKVNEEIIKYLLFGLISLGVAIGVLGLFQYFLYPDLRNLVYLGWDPHYYRLFSTFFDPGFTGAILVLTLILITLTFFEYPRWWLAAGFFLTFLSLFLTFSRSSYLAFLMGMGTVGVMKKSGKFLLTLFLIFFLALTFLPKGQERIATRFTRQETSYARLNNWQESLLIIKDHPLLGVGFNTYRYAQRDYGFSQKTESHAGAGADSSLLFVAATTGFFGLLVYLWLWGEIVKGSQMSERSIVSLAVLSSTIALFAHSWFSNSLFYPWIMEWMWIIIGASQVKKNWKL